MKYYDERIEIKYIVDKIELDSISKFLFNYGVLDPNSNDKGKYAVNTHYLASWKSFSRTVKNHGHLRIRHFLESDNFFLEEKMKIRNKYYKTRYPISKRDSDILKNFNSTDQISIFLDNKKHSFSPQISLIPILDNFNINYVRNAYTISYSGLAFRATIDKELASKNKMLLLNNFVFEVKIESNFEQIVEFFMKNYNILPVNFSKYKLLKNLGK